MQMKVKLGDMFEIGSGGTPSKTHPEYYGGDIPWVKTGDLKSEYLYEVEDFITEEGLNNSSAKVYDTDTVLIAMYGATIGATSILKMSACTNQACAAFKKNEKVIPEYLYYFLKSQKEKFVRDGVGGAQPNISAGYLKKVEMELPSLEEQKVIVEILDKISEVVLKRNQEIQVLDDLIKARFVEMFGDPKINPFNWNVVNISQIVSGKVSNGFFARRDDYCDDGNVGVLGVANIVNRMYSKIEELPRTNANDEDIKKFEVKYGDMLFCRSSLVAEGIGKASIIPKNIQRNILFECHVIRLPLDLKICIPEFIQTLSTMNFFRNQIIAQSKTATMTTIGQDGILKADIILPPIEKQKDFYNFVHQVDKLKLQVQKSLDETQILFDSLMQQYFG